MESVQEENETLVAPSDPTDAQPRILAIMGSGETAPTMARVHRRLLGLLGPPPVPGALLDTPYGFQENADEITARALEYFRENVGSPLALAPFRGSDQDPLLRATALARAREARYLFAGPGSPSYALRQWQGTELPAILAEKLVRGGIVAFASAAALTLGRWTVPVYEVYKVGEEPRWLPGLDILGPLGLPVAVIPHYDNAEGGSHDTRFCYLGERRLATLEAELPDEASILGVDSHTALLLDFGARTATVLGLGGVTVRTRGRSEVLATGASVPLAWLSEAADRLRHGAPAPTRAAPGDPRAGEPGTAVSAPLLDEVHDLERRFEAAVGTDDASDAARAVLELEGLLVAWSRDTTGTDEVDRARAILRSLIVRLSELGREPSGRSGAAGGSRAATDRARLAPLVDALIELRARARLARDFAEADRLRDSLLAAGIELHDTPDGTTWSVAGRDPAPATT